MLAHLVSFRSVPEPAITFLKTNGLHEMPLQGEFSLDFSSGIFCTGYATENDRVRCPYSSKGRKQCGFCSTKDIARVYASLDFTEYAHLEAEYCSQPFSLYLAQFGNNIVKCGVTRAGRVEIRTLEQGADFWAEVASFEEGRSAYKAELLVQNTLRLAAAITNYTKLKLLGHAESSNALKEAINAMAGNCSLGPFCLPEVRIRKNRYIVPSRCAQSDRIDGRITGAKSKLLFYEKNNGHFVVNMSCCEGRIVSGNR